MPGISVSKICVPFGGGGNNWSSYWATRTPGSLMLTVLSDTSIRLNWEANGIEDYDGYSVERSADGVTYSEIDTVLVGTETFTDTGLTADTFYWYRVRAYKGTKYSNYCPFKFAITKPVYDTDGETVADFDFLAGITKDESDLVSAWADRLGSGHDLAQADGAKQPKWEGDGVLGDGSSDAMITEAFAYEQPHFIYAWLKQVTWTRYDQIITGIDAMAIRQNAGTPEMDMIVTNATGQAAQTLKRWGLIKALVSGANSWLYTPDAGKKTGNLNTTGMGGISLFANNAGAFNSNVKIAKAVFRKSSDDAAMEANITKYFERRFGVAALSDIYAMVGKELTLYDNTICEVKIAEEPATGTFTCAVGTDGATGWSYTPEAAGDNAIVIGIVTTSNDWRRTSTIKAYAAAGTGVKKILMIGDSILNHGAPTIGAQMVSILDHLTLQFLGTVGTSPYLSEGKSAYSYTTFCTANASPFVKSGQVDIPAYFEDNGIDTPDFVHLRCGVNDAGVVADYVYGFTWAQLQTVGGYIDTLVNGFLAYDANLKVIIGIPTLCDALGGLGVNSDNYIRANCQLRNYIESKYGSKAYNVRVYLSADGYSMDRANYEVTEGVHPNGTGEAQLGKSIAYTINAILAGA